MGKLFKLLFPDTPPYGDWRVLRVRSRAGAGALPVLRFSGAVLRSVPNTVAGSVCASLGRKASLARFVQGFREAVALRLSGVVVGKFEGSVRSV